MPNGEKRREREMRDPIDQVQEGGRTVNKMENRWTRLVYRSRTPTRVKDGIAERDRDEQTFPSSTTPCRTSNPPLIARPIASDRRPAGSSASRHLSTLFFAFVLYRPRGSTAELEA